MCWGFTVLVWFFKWKRYSLCELMSITVLFLYLRCAGCWRNWSKYISPKYLPLSPPALTNQQLQLKILNQLWSDLVISSLLFLPTEQNKSATQHLHRDKSFVCSVSPFLQCLLKLKGHRVGRGENKVEKWRWGEKKKSWCDDFFQDSFSWSWSFSQHGFLQYPHVLN